MIMLLLGMALAAWMGGHVLLDASAAEPSAFIYDLLIGRTNAAASDAIIGVFVLIAFCVVMLRRNVIQIPTVSVLAPMFVFWVLLAASIPTSRYQFQALHVFACWTTSVVALLACVSSLGRGKGVSTALSVVLSAASLVALSGIYEYMGMSRNAPNWRIFAGWQNPNALAGMLCLAIPCGMALAASARERLLAVLGTSVCMAALWLTASKGGMLSLTIGIAAFFLASAFHRLLDKKRAVSAMAPIAVAAILVALISFAAGAGTRGGAHAGSRLLASGQEGEQSVGFRKRLWQDTVTLVKDNSALGTGLGSYSQSIKRYSATQGSAVAHNSYLQIAAESGVPALLALVIFCLAWLRAVLRKHPGTPVERNVLRMGIVGSVVAGGANLLVESNLSYFGFSVLLFCLMGIGLLLAVDGVMPERAPFASRVIGGLALCIGSLYMLCATAISDYYLASGMAAVQTGNASEAIERFDSAAAVLSMDPQPYAQLSRVYAAVGEKQKAIDNALRALSLGPTAMRYVYLAQAYESAGRTENAEAAYRNAAAFEEKNPFFQRKLFEHIAARGDSPNARSAAEKLIQMETSEYLKLTALPWVVNTDSVGARIYLAEHEPWRFATLVDGARQILIRYMSVTYPEMLRLTGMNAINDARVELKRQLGQEPSNAEISAKLGITEAELRDTIAASKRIRIANQSIEDAAEKYDVLVKITHQIAEVYRELADESAAEAVLRELAGIDGPLR